MIRSMVMACALLSPAAGAAHAAGECPVVPLGREELIAAIAQAPTCRASFEILSACRYNAGGDVELAGIVTERCEKTFLPTLKPPGKRAYAKARKACERKYAGKQGTMYVSAQVICEAEAAVRFAK
jgi:hypothetical protein